MEAVKAFLMYLFTHQGIRRAAIVLLGAIVAAIASYCGVQQAAGKGVQLYPGWNFVAAPVVGCQEVTDLNFGGSLNLMAYWEARAQGWLVYDPDAPASVNGLATVCAGDPLAVHVAAQMAWPE